MPDMSFSQHIEHGNCSCQLCYSLRILNMVIVYARYVILSAYWTWWLFMPGMSFSQAYWTWWLFMPGMLFSQHIEHGNCLCQIRHSLSIFNMVIVYARYVILSSILNMVIVYAKYVILSSILNMVIVYARYVILSEYYTW